MSLRRPHTEGTFTQGLTPPNTRAAVELARDLTAARNAYKNQDANASIQAHSKSICKSDLSGMNEPGHAASGPRNSIQKCFADAGVNALGLNLAVITALTSNQNIYAMIHVHLTRLNIGIALAYAVYVSIFVCRRTNEHKFEYERERRREMWELDNFPQGEKDEMVELYTARGMTQKDAREIINVMAKYENFFVDIMMIEELNMLPPDDSMSILTIGITSCMGSVLCGLMPLVVFHTFQWIAMTTGQEMLSSWIVNAVVISIFAAALRIHTFASAEHEKSYYIGRLHLELPYWIELGLGLFIAFVGSATICAFVVSM